MNNPAASGRELNPRDQIKANNGFKK